VTTMESTEIDLAELAGRLASSRDDAFPDLVEALHGPVFSGAFRLTHNRQDAEDVTQETFVRAYRALGRYPDDQVRGLRLRPWVWTIALNLCRNLARSRRRKPPPSPLDLAADPAASDSPESDALAVVDDSWQRRLDQLAEPVRIAVVLRHVVGLGYAEIAEALDRPVGTVKSDVHRGVDRLRTILATEGAEL
jgi:RNA polymerase sigma factor (sigma-70 family)